MTAPYIFGKIPALTQTAPRAAERNGEEIHGSRRHFHPQFLRCENAHLFRTLPRSCDGTAVFDRPDPRDRLHALCGFLCGWPWGLAVGFLSPLLRSMFGMPPIWVAIPMAFEMATYGAVSGWLYRKLNGRGGRIYLSLITAMLAGRLVWGLVQFLLAGLRSTTFSLAMFLSGAVTTALPGIILQLVLIPVLVVVMERTRIVLDA